MTDNWIKNALAKKGLKKIHRVTTKPKSLARPPQTPSKLRSNKNRGRG
jgi:hypothetical protein